MNKIGLIFFFIGVISMNGHANTAIIKNSSTENHEFASSRLKSLWPHVCASNHLSLLSKDCFPIGYESHLMNDIAIKLSKKSATTFNKIEVKKQNHLTRNLFHPFFTQKIQSKKNYLKKVTWKELHFVGMIKNNRHSWALIQCADGKIRKATIGQFIGKEQLKLIAIKTNRIILKRHWLEKETWRTRLITLPLRS